MGFLLTSAKNFQYTVIPNDFIQSHMISANGNFVKVYLLLLSASQNPQIYPDISVSRLADLLECTEGDIQRALDYWAKQELIQMKRTEHEITEIILINDVGEDAILPSDAEDPAIAPTAEPAPSTQQTITPSVSSTAANTFSTLPEKHEYSPLQAEALANDFEIKKTISAVEKLLGAAITPAHIQNILYFMCDIGFSSELLCTMYEVAVQKGHREIKYMEAIGLNWAQNGILTREDALRESENYDTFYNTIRKALGWKRNFAPGERELIDGWREYQFDASILEEACKRTVLQTGDTNLKYVGKILDKWHQKNVKTLDDVAKCDKEHQKQKNEKPAIKKSGNNRFNNFPQRSYTQEESSSIERQLLQGKRA